jgi:hypothetical protein
MPMDGTRRVRAIRVAHSASLMSELYRGRRPGRSAAVPNLWARQSRA